MLCPIKANHLLNTLKNTSRCKECKHKKVEINEETNEKWVYIDQLYQNEHDFNCEVCCVSQTAEKRVIITWLKECQIGPHWVEKLIYTCKPCSIFLEKQNRYTVGKTLDYAIRNLIYDDIQYDSEESDSEISSCDDFVK